MKAVLKHPQTGEVKEVKVGFSWTTLFFGLFTPLVRGDFKWAIVMLLAGIVTLGFSWLVFPFIYNRLYIKDLARKGFKPCDAFTKEVLRRYNVLFDAQFQNQPANPNEEQISQ